MRDQLNHRGFWIICACEEWDFLWCHNYGHWPASSPRHHLSHRHIDIVDVGSFFTVHFYANIILVHQLCDFCILERFMLHNVAPVASCVTNRKKDRFIFIQCFLKSSFSPGIPINRVSCMLKKIWAAFKN